MNLQEFLIKNNFKLKDTIDWDWDRYGTGIPSVTTVLWLIIDPTFEYIKNTYPEQMQQAADKWTMVHNQAEVFFQRDPSLLVPAGEWMPIELNDQIMKFHVLYDVEVIATEQMIMKDVSWKIDLIWHIWYYRKDMNVDYKNSVNKSEKYKVQCGGYKYLNGLDWILVYAWKWKLKVVLVEDFYTDIFIELKDLFLKLLNDKWPQ